MTDESTTSRDPSVKKDIQIDKAGFVSTGTVNNLHNHFYRHQHVDYSKLGMVPLRPSLIVGREHNIDVLKGRLGLSGEPIHHYSVVRGF